MERDIELLYEIGALRFIPRQWTRFLNAVFANLAEHHLRVMWTAMVIAKREHADIEKVLKIALVHDIAESRTGDADNLDVDFELAEQEICGITLRSAWQKQRKCVGENQLKPYGANCKQVILMLDTLKDVTA